MESEDVYFAALKLFLVFGPLLGFLALELIVLRRDKRRAAQGLPLVPLRRGSGVRSATPSNPEG